MTQLPAGFSIDVGSDQEHEQLVADIYFFDRYVCSVTEERRRGEFDFEFNPSAAGAAAPAKSCPLHDLIVALQAAADKLRSI